MTARLRLMRGPNTERTACVVIGRHAFVQSLRRGPCEVRVDAGPALRLTAASDELGLAI